MSNELPKAPSGAGDLDDEYHSMKQIHETNAAWISDEDVERALTFMIRQKK